MKWGCWGHWGHLGCWGHWGHWGCRGCKAWKITPEDFKVIQAIEFSFILCFEKKFFLVKLWNIILNLSTFSVGGCWGQPILLFWEQMEETQISKPPEATRHHKSKKKYWSFYRSEQNKKISFNVRHPVADLGMFNKK